MAAPELRYMLQVIIETDCGVKLAYCDPRRFGKVRLQENPEENEPVNKLGFDPILSMPDLQTFAGMLAKERRSIKPLILDQVDRVFICHVEFGMLQHVHVHTELL